MPGSPPRELKTRDSLIGLFFLFLIIILFNWRAIEGPLRCFLYCAHWSHHSHAERDRYEFIHHLFLLRCSSFSSCFIYSPSLLYTIRHERAALLTRSARRSDRALGAAIFNFAAVGYTTQKRVLASHYVAHVRITIRWAICADCTSFQHIYRHGVCKHGPWSSQTTTLLRALVTQG